jgi:DNA-binding beta-propeller fold protein YncE
MSTRLTRRRVLQGSAAVGGIALVGGLGSSTRTASANEESEGYELWAFDQGTDTGYIYRPTEGEHGFEQVDSIDYHAIDGVTPNDESAITPHMVAFSSDFAYAAVACTNAGQTIVFRTEDREAVATCPTGPGTHFAGFTPDDEHLQVDAIGEGTIARIDADLENETFSITDRIVVDDDPVFAERDAEFEPDEDGVRGRPICHDYTDTGYSYHTLGPGIDHAGVVVVDWNAFEITEVIAPAQVRANCGTIAHPTEDKFYLTAGAPSNHEPTGGVGEWYVLDTNEHRPIDPETGEVVSGEYGHEDVSRDSYGYDAHGFWFVDETELWIVNRETSNGAVIDPSTDEVIERIDTAEAPDILWGSPDGEYLFASLRGPEPLSGDPHAATGETPGFSVRHVESREIVDVIQPDAGNPSSDFHAVGVRVIDGEEEADFG